MRRMTFEDFLCGSPTRNYVFQDAPYDAQIERAAGLLRDADYVLLGAGAGLSSAAGAVYGGEWFRENFAEFRARYGENNPYMQDLYSMGFYPYPSEEAYWGAWSKEALLVGIDEDVTPLHRVLLHMLDGKNIFCLSTNADEQFTKAGMPAEKIFCTQGDYRHIQCARGCHAKTYDAEALFRKMDAARKDCLIPSELVPKCPICGGPMNMNLRADAYFVQDDAWYAAERRFGDFLSAALDPGRRVCLLELGVGFNTPGIIRFPFEKLVREHDNISLVRLNRSKAMLPEDIAARCVGINAGLDDSITDLARLLAD